MKDWVKILTFLVAFETLLIGIYCCCKLRIDTNSASVLIASLGVLVTFLVTWQIWQTMVSRDEIKEVRNTAEQISKLKAQYESTIESVNQTRNLIRADRLKYLADKEDVLSVKYRIYLDAILHYVKAKEQTLNENLQDCLGGLGDILENADSFNSFERKIFIKEQTIHDEFYHAILQNTNNEIYSLKSLRDNITKIHDNRIKVFDKLNNKQTKS